jgi:hypothetical protein
MKKIFILILFVMFGITCFSQDFNAGAYGGLIASQLDGDTYAGYNKAGLLIGGYVYRYFNKKWAWQLGLRYAQKGSKLTSTRLGIYYKSQLHYFEMPLTLRYFHWEKVDMEFGISLGYLIAALEDKGGYGLEPANPEFNKVELAGIFGISYHFTKTLAVGAHFSYSITAVRPYSSGYETFMDRGQYNNILYFALYYNISSWQ